MKAEILVVFVVLLMLSMFSSFSSVKASASISADWALIISGTNHYCGFEKYEWLRDCYYMLHILTVHWNVPRDHIKFLDINPNISEHSPDPYSLYTVPVGTIDYDCDSYSDVTSAIDWLKAHSTSNDNVLIFITTHGCGYKPGESLQVTEGANDTSEDELNEVKDGANWYGVDERLKFIDKYNTSGSWYYLDDDLATDLRGIACKQMVIIITSCYSGGFIDDLSAPPNRIIITSSSETRLTTVCNENNEEYFTPFIGFLLDALHGYHAVWNPDDVNNRIVDQDWIYVPDLAGDGIDWMDAFVYARNKWPNDDPWFDGNGNGFPTYRDGKNYIEHFLFVKQGGGGSTTPPTGGYEYLEGETVTLKATPSSGYRFGWWCIDDTYRIYNSTYNLQMNSDHKAYAYFENAQAPPGGGDTCPKLFTWSCTAWIDYGVINIHNPTGEDVVREVSIAEQDLAVQNFKVKIRLQEGWPGLNYSHSEIDQVKLYAIINGKRWLCPLIKATYENNNNVWLPLISSDDLKLNIYLLETLDLEFLTPYQNIQDFTFTIEGCNQLKR